MGKAKQGGSVSFQAIEANCKIWLSKPSVSFPLETAALSVSSAIEGAAFSVMYDSAAAYLHAVFNASPPPVPYVKTNSGGHWIEARDYAVLMGVKTGISCVLKKVRGKEDLHSSMMAAFGAGVVFSMVRGKKQPATIIAYGVFYALASGGVFKVKENFSQQEPKWW